MLSIYFRFVKSLSKVSRYLNISTRMLLVLLSIIVVSYSIDSYLVYLSR